MNEIYESGKISKEGDEMDASLRRHNKGNQRVAGFKERSEDLRSEMVRGRDGCDCV